MEKNREYYMKQALKEAEKAYQKLEVPVGAVIVKDGKIIARAHNQKETIYNYDGNFYVDIVEQNNLIEFWLYHKNYGRKNLMFGMDKRYIKYIESIILANIDRSIALYKIDYMQD